MLQMIDHPGVTDEQLTELAICCSSDVDIVEKIAQRIKAINHTIHLLDELYRMYENVEAYDEIINGLVKKVNDHTDKVRILRLFDLYGNVYAIKAMHDCSDYRLPHEKIFELFERHARDCIILKICKDYYRERWDTILEAYRHYTPHRYTDDVKLLSVGFPLTMNEGNLRCVLAQLHSDEFRAVTMFHEAGSNYELRSLALLHRKAFLHAIDCWNLQPSSLAHLHHNASRETVLILLGLGIPPPRHCRASIILKMRRENLEYVSNSMLVYRIPRDVISMLANYCEL
jgi:hypothetical protein